MKKKYEKPQVYMERFELAEHIAQCGLQLNAESIYECTVIADRTGIDATGAFAGSACAWSGDEIYCYSGGPSGAIATFMS